MQTKKDRVQAYQTLVGRMSAALLLGDTNYSEAPARRALIGLVFGVVLALLIGVAFWVYGLINPGGNMAWKKPNVILVEKESGARFVYQHGFLVPVRNHASAMLLQGAGAKVESISRASLSELERGQTIGIENAPDPLPAASALVSTPWLLCLPHTGGVDVQGTGLMSMNANPEAAGGASTRPLAENEYMWVGSTKGEQYVVLRDTKYRLTEPLVAVALGLGTSTPPAAPDAWLAALPNGQDVAPASIPDQGRKGARVGNQDRSVGTVFRQVAGNGTENFAVLRTDGLAPLSRTEAALLQAKNGQTVADIDTATMASVPRSGDDSLTKRLPDLLAAKPIPTGKRAFCLRQRPYGTQVVSQAVTTERNYAYLGMNDRVGAYLRQGTGLLAASVPAPTAKGAKPDRFLITDQGFKYQLANDDAISALGYAGITPQPVSAEVLAQIPSGPLLSRAAVGVLEKGRG
ncbi:type VII secretion protein EccB [Actinosynnema sp. ALI-1.44]|uniref:type VII secretion protein EccB n=1 Tax=Actinosynnema sp. ALI-1.44 TaxID=1933779 RepID=UPI00097C9726|nr:type VII secretion protein EccB [Actinosynnema sp. ALI-1.44]ONI76973.1 type VII secretion protein EccB [Actinosynnema sp. ALI-1.44]